MLVNFSLPVLSQPSTPQSTLADQTSLPFCSLHSPCLFLFFPLLLVNLPLISTFYHYHHVFCTSPLFNSGHTQLYFKSRDFPNHQLLIFTNLTNLTNLSAPSSRSILPLHPPALHHLSKYLSYCVYYFFFLC